MPYSTASKACALDLNRSREDVRERQHSCMLDIMNRHKSLPSWLPLSSLTLLVCVALSSGIASCGSDQACFYFTQVEYDLDNRCPSEQEALTFFQGNTCSSPVVSVDSAGEFDGKTCCYDVTESNDFFSCGVEPSPPFVDGTSGFAVSVSSGGGFGGAGGFGGSGGTGATGGGGACVGCAEFLTNDMPPMLCSNSVPIYEAYSDCMCLGACKTACEVTCKTAQKDPACESCLLDKTNGCGNQHDACAADPTP